MSLYKSKIKAKNMAGELVDFSQYTGKVLLIVNTASKCGYTKQFGPLEEVYKKYKDKDFLILGFPCNQFAGQDPGENDEILSFCQLNYGVTFPMCIKYLHPHSTFRQSDDNLPIYRYAEVLLYLAEAANEQNKTSEAQGYLNQVRNRAGLENTTASSQSELRIAIAKERQVELAFEGKRWWDLVRTGKVQEVISAYGANVKANPQAYYFPVGYEPVPSAFTDFRTKFNLPDTEIRVNPNIN